MKGVVRTKLNVDQVKKKKQIKEYRKVIGDLKQKIQTEELDLRNWRDNAEFQKLDLVSRMKDKDSEFREQTKGINQDFKMFFNDMLKEVHVKTEKLKGIEHLKVNLQSTVAKKVKLSMRITREKEKAKMLMGIQQFVMGKIN